MGFDTSMMYHVCMDGLIQVMYHPFVVITMLLMYHYHYIDFHVLSCKAFPFDVPKVDGIYPLIHFFVVFEDRIFKGTCFSRQGMPYVKQLVQFGSQHLTLCV